MSRYLPLKSFKNKKERGLYVKDMMLAEGLYVLDEYTGSSVPMRCLIMTGKYKGYLATSSWNNFIKGKRPDFRGLLEKEKFIREKFESEGYRVINMPENIKVTDKIDLISPEGNKWAVSYDTFRTGVRCPLDSYKSWGERCIASILKQSGIDFKSQYTITHPYGSLQYMDFYIERNGEKFDIEYNGRQHYYEEPSNRIFNKLKDQQEADKKKYRYCQENDITFIEIPYTIDTVQGVAIELNKYFPSVSTDKRYTLENFNYIKDMVEYYRTHSEKDTAAKFNVSGSTVRKNAYKMGIKKRSNYMTSEEEILSFYKNNSAYKTARKYGITKFVVYGIARKHGFRKRGACK